MPASPITSKSLCNEWWVERLIGRKTSLPKGRRAAYLEPEMKIPTTNRRPPVVMTTVSSWKASWQGQHRNPVMTES